MLEQLRDGLADGFDVFHSVDWSTVDAGVQRFGEIDVVVVDPQGHLVLLEVKAMRQRLQNEGFDGYKVAHLIVLPDHTLIVAPLSFPRERIVDARQVAELCHHILRIINQGQGERTDATADRARLLLFLANHFQLVPDPTARIGVLNNAVTRLSDGLATWVPRIHGDAGIYVIEAAIDHFRRKHGAVDFTEPGIFDKASRELVADSLSDKAPDEKVGPARAYLDLLVIDEMQDMEPQWVEALVSRLKSYGQMYLLGDSQQSVYQREGFDLAGAVHITCNENFRSPRRIVQAINLFGLSDNKILAHCPETGEAPDIRSYPASDAGSVRALEPNEVRSWDITKLKGPAKWTCFHLYVILDIFSRYVVGWLIAERESATLAKHLIEQTVSRQHVVPGALTLHADRGTSMRSKPVASLLVDLDIAKSHSRPYVSDDNPYSESQFKSMKYRPNFPARFGCIEDARAYCKTFFAWYNTEHRHSGIAYMTPHSVHCGHAQAMFLVRQEALDGAFAKHPNRFKGKRPTPCELPTAAWINPPPPETKLQNADTNPCTVN